MEKIYGNYHDIYKLQPVRKIHVQNFSKFTYEQNSQLSHETLKMPLSHSIFSVLLIQKQLGRKI